MNAENNFDPACHFIFLILLIGIYLRPIILLQEEIWRSA